MSKNNNKKKNYLSKDHVNVNYEQLIKGKKYKIIEYRVRFLNGNETYNPLGKPLKILEGIFYGRGNVTQAVLNGKTIDRFEPKKKGNYLRFEFPDSDITKFPLKIDYIYAHKDNKFYYDTSAYGFDTFRKGKDIYGNPNLGLSPGLTGYIRQHLTKGKLGNKTKNQSQRRAENRSGGKKKHNKTNRKKNKKNKTNKIK